MSIRAFFHASPEGLSAGDVLSPGHAPAPDVPGFVWDTSLVWMTPLLAHADEWALIVAEARGLSEMHVYEVRPVGRIAREGSDRGISQAGARSAVVIRRVRTLRSVGGGPLLYFGGPTERIVSEG